MRALMHASLIKLVRFFERRIDISNCSVVRYRSRRPRWRAAGDPGTCKGYKGEPPLYIVAELRGNVPPRCRCAPNCRAPTSVQRADGRFVDPQQAFDVATLSTIKHALGATAAPFKRTQWSYPAVLNRHKEYTVFHTMSFPAFSSPASSTKCFITVVLFCILLPMSVISM